jgi:hypothetical protein
MEDLAPYLEVLTAIANVFTIAASGLAVVVFVRNREKLSAAFRLLLNYSFQTTLTELKEKIERLNEYNANEPEHLPEIRNILHEIAGQIRGNSRLAATIPTLAGKVETLARSKRLNEPAKRSIVSEVREQIRNIQINTLEPTAGQNHE